MAARLSAGGGALPSVNTFPASCNARGKDMLQERAPYELFQ
jgi:hypothetical protein